MPVLIFEMTCIYSNEFYFSVKIRRGRYAITCRKTSLNCKDWATRCTSC